MIIEVFRPAVKIYLLTHGTDIHYEMISYLKNIFVPKIYVSIDHDVFQDYIYNFRAFFVLLISP